jgi:hypothetical protein
MGDDDALNDFSRLVAVIREELLAQSAGFRLCLSAQLIEQMARGIADGIDYTFEFNWSPGSDRPTRPVSD